MRCFVTGESFKAHRLVLAACSAHFSKLFSNSTLNGQLIVILEGTHHQDLQILLQFMYKGVAYLHQDRIESVLRTAEVLQVSRDPVTGNLNSLTLPRISWHSEPTTLTTCQQNWILDGRRWIFICIRQRDKIQFDPILRKKCPQVLRNVSGCFLCWAAAQLAGWLLTCNPNHFRAGLLVKVTPLQSQSRCSIICSCQKILWLLTVFGFLGLYILQDHVWQNH